MFLQLSPGKLFRFCLFRICRLDMLYKVYLSSLCKWMYVELSLIKGKGDSLSLLGWLLFIKEYVLKLQRQRLKWSLILVTPVNKIIKVHNINWVIEILCPISIQCLMWKLYSINLNGQWTHYLLPKISQVKLPTSAPGIHPSTKILAKQMIIKKK